MDVVKLFTDADVRSLYVLNALLCFVGLLWTWGISSNRRDTLAYRGWIVFWAGTGVYIVYYLLTEVGHSGYRR